MKNRSNIQVLGVTATSRAVHGVLVREGLDGPEVLRRFSRPRSRSTAGLSPSTVGAAEGVLDTAGGHDFTIQFGDTAGASRELFLASEFGGLEKEGGDDGAAAPPATFELELRDLLDEVRDAGFDDPVVAFALASGDAAFVELRVSEPPKGRKVDQGFLVELLGQQYKGLFEEERVAFLPMTPGEDGLQRYLAVFPKLSDPVAATLRTMREAHERLPAVQLLDAEVPLFVGLARLAQRQLGAEPPPEETAPEGLDDAFAFNPFGPRRFNRPPEGQPLHTLVVRAGADDTLVLFLQGEVLHHCESLRSLTAFDAPETVCSRVLLQQDEHGLGDVHHVLLLSEEREAELIETFEMFFPDARVESMRDYLPRLEDGADAPAGLVPATAVALRLSDDTTEGLFAEINFLPKRLAGRRVRLPFTWHMAALSVLIVFTTLFFAVSYSNGASEIESYRMRLDQVGGGAAAADVASLQAQIDSMQALHQTYMRALEVLDTLLVGSDRWSRALERTARETAAVRGIWVESMTPAAGALQFLGTSTSRDRIVMLAQRLDATLKELTFSEIREWPVYTFHMEVPLHDALPAAALYLREQVELPDDTAGPMTGETTDDTPGGAAAVNR